MHALAARNATTLEALVLGPSTARELELEAGEGERAIVEITSQGLCGVDGSSTAMLVRFRRRRDEAHALNVCRVAGNLAHDLNNVLGAVLLNAQIATEIIGREHPARFDLDELRKAAESATHLTRQLLAISRSGHR